MPTSEEWAMSPTVPQMTRTTVGSVAGAVDGDNIVFPYRDVVGIPS